MKALFFNESGIFEREIEDYDMGWEAGVWPEATKNNYHPIRRYISDDDNIVHFQKGFDGHLQVFDTQKER